MLLETDVFFKICPFMAALYYKSFHFIVFITTKSAQSWITWPLLLLLPPPPSECLNLLLASIILEQQLGSAYSSLHKLLGSFSIFSESRLSVPIVATLSCCNASFPGHTENPCPSCALALHGAAS